MKVHRITAEDYALLDATVRTFRKVEVRDHRPFLADPATLAFVALLDDVVVGWIWGHRQHHVCGYTQFQIYEIEVSESARRRGIGRALFEHFATVARMEGAAKMWLFTDEDNHPAKALYSSMGGHPSPHDDATYWWQLERQSQLPSATQGQQSAVEHVACGQDARSEAGRLADAFRRACAEPSKRGEATR